jgi:general secretion pathway protein G
MTHDSSKRLISYSDQSFRAIDLNTHRKIDVFSKNSGFTLIELLMVIAIIGILSTLAIPSYNNYKDKTRNARAMSEIRTMGTEISGYILDNGGPPPDTPPGPTTGLGAINRYGFKDPWGNDYQYKKVPALFDKDGYYPLNTDFDLYSKGKDGQSLPASPNLVNYDDIARSNNGAFAGLR